MKWVEKNLDKIYFIYLVIAFVVLTAYAFIMKRHIALSLATLVVTLIQCYFIFKNKGKLIGVMSITNCSINGYVNLINNMYSSFIYSIYGAFVGIFLVLKGKNTQTILEFKKTIFKLISIFILGFITFIVMNHSRAFSIVLIFDLIIFAGNVTGGFLASQQSIWQFYMFIPIGFVQISAGMILGEPIYIISSLIYLFSDILSVIKWRSEHRKTLKYNNS